MGDWIPATDEDRRMHAAIFGAKEAAGLQGWYKGMAVIEWDELPEDVVVLREPPAP